MRLRDRLRRRDRTGPADLPTAGQAAGPPTGERPAAPPPAGQAGSGASRDEAAGGQARDPVPGGPAGDVLATGNVGAGGAAGAVVPGRRAGETAARNGKRRRGGDGKGGDRPMVPPAEFRSYYGRPVVKAAVWHHDIAAYLFTGGLAAGSSLLAAGGQATGSAALRRAGRVTALGAVTASAYFLIHDLGRPARFHHMLRVAKPTSPMSVGTWILSAFGPAAAIAATAEVAPLLPDRGLPGLAKRVLPPVGSVGGWAAAATAPALATYTAVLLADTATPSWHEAYPELPFVFAGSALASAAGVGLLAAPPGQAWPARRLAILGGALELAGAHRVETTLGLLSEPYTTGRAGRLLRTGRALTAAGVVGSLVGHRSRAVSALSGVALLAASVATRFGIFDGGVASARDPKYTVLPQRERLARRAAGEHAGQDRADIAERDVAEGGATSREMPDGPAATGV